MLYLAIHQHSKQITVCVRDADGDTVVSRQVSTRPEKLKAFLQELTEMDREFMAILEVCGFNDWLIEELRRWNCREIVLIHPERPSKRKADRRDAREVHLGAVGLALLEARFPNTVLVSKDQKASLVEDRSSGRDAQNHDRLLAHVDLSGGVFHRRPSASVAPAEFSNHE